MFGAAAFAEAPFASGTGVTLQATLAVTGTGAYSAVGAALARAEISFAGAGAASLAAAATKLAVMTAAGTSGGSLATASAAVARLAVSGASSAVFGARSLATSALTVNGASGGAIIGARYSRGDAVSTDAAVFRCVTINNAVNYCLSADGSRWTCRVIT